MEHTVAQPPTHEWLPRPTELAQDDTPMIAVVQHALETLKLQPQDILTLLQPTQPFRTPDHVRAAVTLLQDSKADSVVSVTAVPLSCHPDQQLFIDGGNEGLTRIASLYVASTLADASPASLPSRRQSLEPTYRRDGTVYAFWRKTVSRYSTIYGQDVRPLIIPPDETCELDTLEDWATVERRWQERHAAHG
jgi:CMP-N,N'-diacetyllegionaminic acid synthase